MTQNESTPEQEGQPETDGGIGPESFGASAAEAGSLYADRGPTIAQAGGEPPNYAGPGEDPDVDLTGDSQPSIGDVNRGGP